MNLDTLFSPATAVILAVVFVALAFVKNRMSDRKTTRDLHQAHQEFELSNAHPALRGRERSYVYEVTVPYWLLRVMTAVGFAGSVTTTWAQLPDDAQGEQEDYEDSL